MTATLTFLFFRSMFTIIPAVANFWQSATESKAAAGASDNRLVLLWNSAKQTVPTGAL
jgi:hypothetical protein